MIWSAAFWPLVVAAVAVTGIGFWYFEFMRPIRTREAELAAHRPAPRQAPVGDLPNPGTEIGAAMVHVLIPLAANAGWADPEARGRQVFAMFAARLVSYEATIELLHEIGQRPEARPTRE